MDQLAEAMLASIDTYNAVLDCKCDGLCKCDDALALSAASQSLDIRPRGC